ncbi:MAG: MBL fold metallo-hydrolase [Pirellulales bacterium]
MGRPVPAASAPADTKPITTETIGSDWTVIHGAVNGALLRRGGKTLAVYGDPRQEPPAADMVLLTHHRRDVAWAARALVARGAKAVVPAAEADLFSQVAGFWSKFVQGRYHDYQQQTTKILAEVLPVNRTVRGGDTVTWEGVSFRVLDTPGYTRGAVSYLAKTGGKSIAFTGDLIQADGKLLDLYSLQDAFPEGKIGGYHGYAARLGALVDSLRKLAAEKPDVLVPARGPIIADPQAAIATLIGRIEAVYANYLSIDALRWYFGDDHIRAKARRILGPAARVEWMPMAETVEKRLPSWIVPVSNSRLIVSSDKSGFLVDCGNREIVELVKKRLADGTLASVDGLFITHYHDDHTSQVPRLIEVLGGGADRLKVYACGSLVDVLEKPWAYRLPCGIPDAVHVAGNLADRTTWRWKDFELTLYDFPGQTIHHNALLVKKDRGEKILFVGDSFTPSGIDDYCLQNRNLLHPGTGFFRCLAMLKQMPPDCLLINQHVEPAFRFSPAQIERMENTLKKRVELLGDLVAWDDPNFGLDEGWARFYPYGLEIAAGQTGKMALVITNHSPKEQTFRVRIHPPAGWTVREVAPGPVRIDPRQDGRVALIVTAPSDRPGGPGIVTADVAWDGGDLREWAEAMLSVRP